jgi:hypothetical protein
LKALKLLATGSYFFLTGLLRFSRGIILGQHRFHHLFIFVG